MVEADRELVSPFEIVEMIPCRDYYFAIEKWEVGKATIHPRYAGAPKEKVVTGIRLYAREGYKPTAPHWWDLFPKRLVYGLKPLLPTTDWTRWGILIHRDIPGPGAHFSVKLVPLVKVPKPIVHPRPR